MSIYFDSIDEEYVKKLFPSLFSENSVFFEIISNFIPIGFYGVETITDKVCEISLYLNKKDRYKLTKNIAIKCLNFPFFLGFKKILIHTDLQKMYKFLMKMTKYGVNYLFKHNDIYWFEVLPWA